MTIHHMRRTYQAGELLEEGVSSDPFEQFRLWFDQAKSVEVPHWFEVNAMTLSTSDPVGQVSSRIVLLKMLDPRTDLCSLRTTNPAKASSWQAIRMRRFASTGLTKNDKSALSERLKRHRVNCRSSTFTHDREVASSVRLSANNPAW